MNVLVISEDFRKDEAMLKPLISAMLEHLGKPKAKIRICNELLGGVAQALREKRLLEIIDRNKGMTHLFLLCVDRDGNERRKQRLSQLEEWAKKQIAADKIFLAENAWQEIEVWVLAGLSDLPNDWAWQDVRKEANPKEAYYLPLAEKRGLLKEPKQGRQTLGEEAARNYDRIRQLCSEDIGNLESRIGSWLEQ